MPTQPTQTNPIRFGAIWAQTQSRIIGQGGDMPWRVPADFRHFKSATMGAPVLMGRKCWESLSLHPLPGRKNLVCTRNEDWQAEGAQVFNSLQAAKAYCETNLATTHEDSSSVPKNEYQVDAWVIGGGQIYEQSLPWVDVVVVSLLDLDITPTDADVFAPELDPNTWELDETLSDDDWREKSGDARWKVQVYRRR
ncbi:hypothetical protein BK816_02845 [Boudabousia tangfeifanii]|uniref:Dihydrofolate reductase n=1 Tax=Boudabousia tangfeifanii TaxID=1912795 RepID=A0A1D9MJI0_9ACTO|nr:dihydrofolate reductase [Boudabousia tangfeifanii]AOZ72368.1 hypothetical protein BK816_02845 [Boudabousia tangfeifanii]